MRIVAGLTLAVALAATSAAVAQPKGKDKTAPAKGAKKVNVVPKDPDNIKGISPYEEQLAEGRRLASTQNWAAAAAAFEKAIGMNPDDARGYLLLAQSKRDGDVMPTVETGRTKKAPEHVEAKLMFVRAELLERKASLTPTTGTGDLGDMLKTVWDQSVEAWKSYAAFVTTHTRAPDYKATAEARQKAIADREAREQQYAPVRAKKDNK